MSHISNDRTVVDSWLEYPEVAEVTEHILGEMKALHLTWTTKKGEILPPCGEVRNEVDCREAFP